ncbi:aKG-HExxH-type peptide beta-hydroxylase [Nocardia sp. NPDC051750]|uniref:aKG-HExxH-type peptide beta-hydroxylase n=1 Tax=Nocardia sp. NPDC051750 TaxID=3364325 RepID=UPI0037AD5144
MRSKTTGKQRIRTTGRGSVLDVSDIELDALATLSDPPQILPLLERARISRNLAFLAVILREGNDSAQSRPARTGFDLLVDVQRRDAAAAQEIFQHPRFGAWVAVCAVGTGDDGVSDAPLAHLTSFAAAAAVRAGLEFELELPRVGDAVVLPGLGCWTGPATLPARVRHDGGGTATLDGYRWTPVRRLTARLPSGVVDIEFDDLPPTPSAWPAVDIAGYDGRWTPWDEAEFEDWQRIFGEAMELLVAVVPELAVPLTRGIRAVLPRAGDSYPFVTSTLADSFGAAAMVLPADAVRVAAGLLHEFQHSKLSVLMEIRPLIAVEGPADLPSPWRREPRPASALLHGSYAHLAVSRFLRLAAGHLGPGAVPDADPVRRQTLTACDTLLESDRLTPAGRRFVTLMRHTAAADFDGHPAAQTV